MNAIGSDPCDPYGVLGDLAEGAASPASSVQGSAGGRRRVAAREIPDRRRCGGCPGHALASLSYVP
jgi:hypothetical protein